MKHLTPAELSPVAEAARLDAVRRYDILDTPPDGSFDRITAAAARLFSTPIAIISLVDEDRIWFKSHHGLDVEQIDRGPGLCASAILQDDPWVLTNALTDVRSLANPLVAGEFGLRFYVGAPLRTSDGHSLGTLCVIDREPRAVSDDQIATLKDLASLVIDQMELRLAARRAVAEVSGALVAKEAALKRTALMAKEIDHRVMNSLQLISGMLTMQGRASSHAEAARELAYAAGRVAAIARVHQHIYLSETTETADASAYLRRLCDDLCSMLPGSGDGQLLIETVDSQVPTGVIVSLGLLVNELVTNAVKHGAGPIQVSFLSVDNGHVLRVCDSGPGLPPGFDPAAAHGLGMKVIAALVQQLQGDLSYGPGDDGVGACFTVRFRAF